MFRLGKTKWEGVGDTLLQIEGGGHSYEEVVIIWYYSHLLAPFCDRSSMGV